MSDSTPGTSQLITSKSRRPRTSWFLSAIKVADTYQVQIRYKNARNKIETFSKDPQNATVKTPWGPFKSVTFEKRRENGNLVKEFKFVNEESEYVSFDIMIMDYFRGGINSFSQRMITMHTKEQYKLLSMYLTLVQHSEGFVHYRKGFHFDDGFREDGGGIQISDLEKEGGSIDSYTEFLDLVKSSANENLNEISSNKRSSNMDEGEGQTPKVPRKELIESKAAEELANPDGLEVKYQKSIIGVTKIPLKNISVHEELVHLVMNDKVKAIAEEIKSRYDPSQSILMVCPESNSSPLDLKNIKDRKFFVVQKIQTYMAFNKLDESGHFRKLTGHSDGLIVCYVINPGNFYFIITYMLTEN